VKELNRAAVVAGPVEVPAMMSIEDQRAEDAMKPEERYKAVQERSSKRCIATMFKRAAKAKAHASYLAAASSALLPAVTDGASVNPDAAAPEEGGGGVLYYFKVVYAGYFDLDWFICAIQWTIILLLAWFIGRKVIAETTRLKEWLQQRCQFRRAVGEVPQMATPCNAQTSDQQEIVEMSVREREYYMSPLLQQRDSTGALNPTANTMRNKLIMTGEQ